MADHANSTSAPDSIGPRPTDAEFARAYFDLDSAIHKLRQMSALMDVVAEDTVLRVEDQVAGRVHSQMGLEGYHIHILTKDQNDGLDYAIRHLGDLIRSLHDAYYAGFKRKVA